MALLIGVFGQQSKLIAEAIKQIYGDKEPVVFERDTFLCLGLVDQKHDNIIPVTGAGIIAGKLFSRDTYLPVKSLDLRITSQDLISSYWGRYISVLWDEKNQSISILRDPIGLSTLFYYQTAQGDVVFSTDLAALYDVLPEKPELDWNHFVEFLHDSNHALPTTPFIGIAEVLPGMQYTISAKGITQNLLWSPPLPNEQLIHASEDEIIQGVYDELVKCAGAWMVDVPGVTVELSGGVDSSSLLALYTFLAQGRMPITAVHHTDSAHISSQELHYAQQIAKGCGVPLTVLDYQKRAMVEDLPQGWRPARPSGFLPFYSNSRELLEYATQAGCPEIISGQGGDHVFLAPPMESCLADYVLERGLRGISGPFSEIRDHYRAPTWQLIKKSIRGISHYYQGKLDSFEDEKSTLMKNEMLGKIEAAPYYLDPLLKKYYPAKAQHIRGIAHAVAYGDRDQRFANSIVTLPLLSQPLVEYALRIPVYRSIKDGYNRYFFRKAISRFNDTKVIWRRNKGEVSSTYLKAALAQKELIRSMLHEGHLVKQGIISSPWVDDRIQQMRHGKGEYLLPFFRAISCEMWFNQWKM